VKDRVKELSYVSALRFYGFTMDMEAIEDIKKSLSREPLSFILRVTEAIEEAGPMTAEEAEVIASLHIPSKGVEH
jgi:hypothetical protein